tara:strand:- start:1231 stop:2715 length:1485 start_codon:yes stop_codon:yes gene_type:complete
MISCTSIFKVAIPALFFIFLGAMSIFGFAPFNFYLIPLFTLLLFLLINHKNNTHSYISSISFGLGFFLAGLYWIYISLNIYGQMPSFLAALSTFLFCLFLSLFFIPLCSPKYKFSILFFPAFFTIIEWIRSFIFTGFPWLSYGYSQIYDSPLSGYLPIVGVHGVTFLILLTVIICYKTILTKKNISRLMLILLITSIWFGGYFLKKIKWTSPQGEPISISLVQGNISQDKKWDITYINESFNKYLKMIESSSASLIILPETSIPVLQQNIPDQFRERLFQHSKKNNGNILYGVIEKDRGYYFNSAISVGINGDQKYQKYHLVPFGEFIPFKRIMQFVYENWLNIPFNDISRGPKNQEPLTIKNHKIAINICYEDVFGNEIIKPLPKANILVNLSNDAWYGESIASQQHLQISQARAIETGRMMVRATNTGATAIINTDGKLIKQLPLFKEGTLNGYVQGYEGETPYIKYGNFPIIILSFLIFLYCLFKRKISKK